MYLLSNEPKPDLYNRILLPSHFNQMEIFSCDDSYYKLTLNIFDPAYLMACVDVWRSACLSFWLSTCLSIRLARCLFVFVMGDPMEMNMLERKNAFEWPITITALHLSFFGGNPKWPGDTVSFCISVPWNHQRLFQ